MKIGILLWELDIAGGTQRQVLHLARELILRGDDVRVYCARGNDPRCYSEIRAGLPIRSLEEEAAPAPRRNLLPRALLRWMGRDAETETSRRMARALPGDLDLLNVHDYLAYPAAYFWRQGTGRPVVWMMNDLPGAMSPQGGGRGPWRSLERFLVGKAQEGHRHRGYARAFDSIVVLDDRNRELVRRSLGKEAEVIRSGLDLDAFPWTPRNPPAGERPLRIFSNAILFPYRRLEDIVEALSVLHARGVRFEWTHAGRDSRDRRYADRIYGEVARLGLSSAVRFVGEVSEDLLRKFFREADIFVFPNSPQTWGLAVFQAMACGTPAVVSRGAGASEVLTDGINALLVDPCSPGQLADAVDRLRLEPNLWTSLHREGRRFVEERIRWDLYAARMREVFERALRTAPPPVPPPPRGDSRLR